MHPAQNEENFQRMNYTRHHTMRNELWKQLADVNENSVILMPTAASPPAPTSPRGSVSRGN